MRLLHDFLGLHHFVNKIVDLRLKRLFQLGKRAIRVQTAKI